MFGLSKREQRWKAEQKAAESLVSLAAVAIKANADVEIAKAKAKEAEALKQHESVFHAIGDEKADEKCKAVLAANNGVVNFTKQEYEDFERNLKAYKGDIPDNASVLNMMLGCRIAKQAKESNAIIASAIKDISLATDTSIGDIVNSLVGVCFDEELAGTIKTIAWL